MATGANVNSFSSNQLYFHIYARINIQFYLLINLLHDNQFIKKPDI